MRPLQEEFDELIQEGGTDNVQVVQPVRRGAEVMITFISIISLVYGN